MTLFGFCLQMDGKLYEAAAWGPYVDHAFEVVNSSDVALAAFPQHQRRPDDERIEWEWCELAFFCGPLIWWLEAGEA